MASCWNLARPATFSICLSCGTYIFCATSPTRSTKRRLASAWHCAVSQLIAERIFQPHGRHLPPSQTTRRPSLVALRYKHQDEPRDPALPVVLAYLLMLVGLLPVPLLSEERSGEILPVVRRSLSARPCWVIRNDRCGDMQPAAWPGCDLLFIPAQAGAAS